MTDKKYTNIIVTGSVAYDEILDFPKEFKDFFQPDKLHNINVSFVVDRLEKQLGGTATNIAYNLSLVADLPIKVLAGLGRDNHDFTEFFKKHNIVTDGVLIDDTLYTATGKVITDIKDNQIWGFYYGACAKAKDIDFAKHIDDTSFMIISANHKDAFIAAQKYAINDHISYMYDIGMAITWIEKEYLIEGINNCSYLIGNDYEISQIEKMTGIKMSDLIEKDKIVITTLGEKGVEYKSKKETFIVLAYPIKEIVDPTGAGDAFRGGFVSGLVKGMPTVECLKLGNVLASFAVEKYGTANHNPTKEEIDERVEKIKS
jgi:adenosine kinase